MSDKKKKGDEPGYGAASAELEQILLDIESGEIDLDVLTEKVERAAALLAICRQKLAATETKVKKVVADLASADDGAAADTAHPDDGEDAR
jgi:exodeoxyribonuclease VII small subunit